jgi:DNA-binding XRE family transcriptional regulator
MKTHYRLLKAIRIANDISQRQMTELAGVSERSIATMESGRDTTMKTTLAVQRAFETKGIRFLETADSGYGVLMPADGLGLKLWLLICLVLKTYRLRVLAHSYGSHRSSLTRGNGRIARSSSPRALAAYEYRRNL